MGPTHRWQVETCFKPGVWTCILDTDDYDRAASLADFWDERQDTRLIDRESLSTLDLALLRFDEALANLGES